MTITRRPSAAAPSLQKVENVVADLRAVGAELVRRVDVRVISATNRNLADLVEQQKFREDLYYRIRGAVIELPPLRHRRSVRCTAPRCTVPSAIPPPARCPTASATAATRS